MVIYSDKICGGFFIRRAVPAAMACWSRRRVRIGIRSIAAEQRLPQAAGAKSPDAKTLEAKAVDTKAAGA